MKISKLLVLSALLLTGSGTAMAVDGNVWPLPQYPASSIPEASSFVSYEEEATIYLYNVKTHLFYVAGNEWGTRASLIAASNGNGSGPTVDEEVKGAAVYFTRTDAAIEKGDGVVELKSFVEKFGNSLSSFAGGWNDVWTDNDNRDDRFWTVTPVGDSYRISNVVSEPSLCLGWMGTDTRLYLLDPSNSAYGVDWKLVPEDAYETWLASITEDHLAIINNWKAEMTRYNTAQELKTVLDEAEAIGAAVADQIAVYNNTNSTLEELQAAITAAQQAIEKRKAEMVDEQYDNATLDKPVDVTSKFLTNYDFKGDNLTTGWSGTAFGSYGPKENAEHYNKTYDTYQNVNGGLKPGIYAVGANAFYRAGNAQPAWDNYKAGNAQSKYAKLYAQAGKLAAKDFVDREAAIVSPCVAMIPVGTEVVGAWSTVNDTDEYGETVASYLIPNNMEGAEYAMHTLGLYANKVIVAVNAETDTLRLGVRKSASVDADWSIFDDFSLTYYGKGADACNFYLTEALKNYGEYTPEDGVIYTEAYLTAYQEALKGDKTANSLEEVNAVLGAIDKSYADLLKNIELWQEFQRLMNEGLKMSTEAEYQDIEEMLDMMDFIEMDGEDMLDGLKATNEELEKAIAQLQEWITTVLEKSKLDVWDGKDYTKYITNAGFDEDKDINSGSAEGWTIDRVSGGNVTRGPLGQGNQDIMVNALGEQNFCFESWHCHQWDVWQEVKNLPIGMYELQVQGYVRCEVQGYAQGDPIEPDYPSPVYLYMNNAMTSFPSVYSEQIADEHYLEDGTLPVVEGHSWTGTVPNTPNSMGAASLCFKWGMYKKQAYGLIAKEGDTFRIGVKMDADQDWWCIWDNFKLTYREPTAELVQPVLEEEMAKLDLTKPMGKDVYEKAAALKQAAQEAIASGDGKVMFDVLGSVYDLSAAINSSVALFVRLQDAAIGLWDNINASDNQAAKQEAQTLYYQIIEGIEAHAITDAEAEEYIEKIAAMRTPLLLPGDYASATDDHPVDVTSVIMTPNFDKDYVNSIEGWTTSGYNFGNDDTQKGALALEYYNKTFDIHQDIVGLPEGTYEVGVKAFSRNGGTAEDFSTYAENPDFSLAYLYAVNGASTVSSVPVAPLSKGALSEDPGISGQTSYTPAGSEITYYFPNDMVSAVAFFEMPNSGYENKVVVKVLADGKLTIGMKKNQTQTYCWVLLDSWTLNYLGTNSAKQPDGDASGISEMDAQQRYTVEFFTLDGRKANGMQKGIMIQKMTSADGNVVVRKVRK